jgi:predicted DNA binding protein
MARGIRAEVRVTRPTRCPLVDVTPDVSVRSVSRATSADDEFVTEFVADGQVDGAEKVFDYDCESVYRIVGESTRPCACARIERMGYPVREHRVDGDTVTLAFFVPEVESLRTVLESFAADGYDLEIRRLTRSESDEEEAALVYVDRGELTDRQLEVLRTAEVMGYFEHPKEANAGEVAAELGISTSTFTEHLSAAQQKVLGAVLG